MSTADWIKEVHGNMMKGQMSIISICLLLNSQILIGNNLKFDKRFTILCASGLIRALMASGMNKLLLSINLY